jgi:hypothetical protein
MRFDVFRSLYAVEPSTIVHVARSVLCLPALKRFTARDVMRGHPSSSCSAAACAILALLMTAQSTPHPRLEILDISGNGEPLSLNVCLLEWRQLRCISRCLVIGGTGVVMSQRMCFMVACARFQYHGRMTAGRVFFCFFVLPFLLLTSLLHTHFAGRETVPFELKSHQRLRTQKAALLPPLL